MNWNDAQKKFWETGLGYVVLFPHDPITNAPLAGIAWEGVISINESPTGGDDTELYANNFEYARMRSQEELEGKIEGYTYPDELDLAMGTLTPSVGVKVAQQSRSQFSMVYRTMVYNDAQGYAGEVLHVLYNLRLKPSERSSESVNESPDAITFSWDFTSTKREVGLYLPASKLMVDTRYASQANWDSVFNLVYTGVSTLPTPDVLLGIFDD